MHHRRPVPVQRRGMGVDDTALDPAAMQLRGQQQPGRACADHENSHISNHVELLVEKTGVTSEAIYFGPKSRGQGKNWLATIPDNGFFVIFRLYRPKSLFFGRKQAFYNQTWQLPDIEKVK